MSEKHLESEINKIWSSFEYCMSLADRLFKKLGGNVKVGTKIKIKKGSTVYIGNGIYATLIEDTYATIGEK